MIVIKQIIDCAQKLAELSDYFLKVKYIHNKIF